MNCLIVAATTLEIAPFLKEYRQSNRFSNPHPDVQVLVTGVGLTAATYHLTTQFSILRPSLVIQAGVAGCFDTSRELGSVVTIASDVIADEGVTEQQTLKSVFDLGLAGPHDFPYKKGRLVNPDKNLLKKNSLKPVTGISVNQVTTSPKTIRAYREKYNPVTESMEGAALHYVCLREHIPFLQIRALSNYIGERNKKKWKMGEAIHNLNHTLLRLLETL